MYAKEVARGRVFCMGDAVHRHPPLNGLGSNVSIQDAHNLAWKLAFVLTGKADPGLLESYDAERAPVAAQTVKRANKSLGAFPGIFGALGLLDTQDPKQMRKNMAARKRSTKKAAEQRAALRQALDDSDVVYNAHGVEMNQRYESAAIVPDDTEDPGFARDLELYYQASSRPGAHVPHAWLIDENGHKVSTLDLCGGGRFTLLTGIGGEDWTEAAQEIKAAFGVEVDVHIVGPGQEFDDPYGDWVRVREMEETGTLLVRPDLLVGWRAEAVSANATQDLVSAMEQILGRAADDHGPEQDGSATSQLKQDSEHPRPTLAVETAEKG